MVGKLGLDGSEEVSWGGHCRKVRVFTNEVGNKKMRREQWEEKIKEVTMGGDYDVAFTNGSKLEGGETGSGWTVRNQFRGGKGLGNRATVWGAEVTAIVKILRLNKGKRLLILSDSY